MLVIRDPDDTKIGSIHVPEEHQRAQFKMSGIVIDAGTVWCKGCKTWHESDIKPGDRVYFERCREEHDMDGYGNVAVLYHDYIWGVEG